MRLIFFGTPEFAIPSLNALAAAKHEISGVVTRPDRPRGRGRRVLAPSPIAEMAGELGLPLFKPERATDKEFIGKIREIHPLAFVVVAYGALLPDELLRLPPRGGWNVHPSLLPRWRGPAPIHRAVWAGDTNTGVSIMKLSSRLDAGPIALQQSVPIIPSATRGDLELGLAKIGASLLTKFLETLEKQDPDLTEQDEAAATFAPVFSAQERKIKWDLPASQLHRLIMAMTPEPGAYFLFGECRVKVIRSRAAERRSRLTPGSLISRDSAEGWSVSCSQDVLEILAVQPQGKEPMTMNDFVIGRRLKCGDSLSAAEASRVQ